MENAEYETTSTRPNFEFANGGHFSLRALDVGKDSPGREIERAARVGKNQPPTGPIEQRGAESTLERANCLRQRGLRNVESLSGLRYPTVVDDSDEVGNEMQIHSSIIRPAI